MKSKNIFLTLAFALFMFGACSEEKIIDGPDVIGKASLTLELSTSSSPITKTAYSEGGYEYATKEELTIKNCWVFIVKGDNIEKRQYFETDNGLSDTHTNYEENNKTYTKGYSVTFKNLEYGQYDLYVIANPSSDNSYKNYNTLTELKKIVEGSDKYQTTFGSGILLKTGYVPVNFTAESKNEIIKVPLTQLAAKVKVNLTIGVPSISFTEMTSTVSNIRLNALIGDPMSTAFDDVLRGEYELVKYLFNSGDTCKISFYTYGKEKGYLLKVKLQGTYNVDKSYSSNFDIKIPDKITEGCIKNGHFYEVTASIKSLPIQGNLNVEIENIKVFKEGEEIKFEFN